MRSLGLLALLTLGCASTLAAESLLTAYEDSTGHALQTREVTVYTDGRVIEERYDWSTEPPAYTRTQSVLLQREVQSVIAAVDAIQPCELPKVIPSARTFVTTDPPHRSIGVYGLEPCRVRWDSPYDPSGEETQRFERIWSLVTGLAEPAHCGSADFSIRPPHMTKTLETPLVVRELRGRFLVEGDAFPDGSVDDALVRFQVNGPRGISIRVPVSPDGTFHLPDLPPGRYCFRTSSDYLRGYAGVIVIDPHAPDEPLTFNLLLGA